MMLTKFDHLLRAQERLLMDALLLTPLPTWGAEGVRCRFVAAWLDSSDDRFRRLAALPEARAEAVLEGQNAELRRVLAQTDAGWWLERAGLCPLTGDWTGERVRERVAA